MLLEQNLQSRTSQTFQAASKGFIPAVCSGVLLPIRGFTSYTSRNEVRAREQKLAETTAVTALRSQTVDCNFSFPNNCTIRNTIAPKMWIYLLLIGGSLVC